MSSSYAFEEMNDNMARAYGRALAISTKMSVEICKNIRRMSVEKAKKLLEKVITKETAIKIVRYGRDTAHKKTIGPGKFPVKAAKEILNILKSAELNAQNKGLSTNDLVIKHISAHKASQPWHYGRKKRSRMKRTHIQIVLLEKKSQKPKNKIAKKEALKQEEANKGDKK